MVKRQLRNLCRSPEIWIRSISWHGFITLQSKYVFEGNVYSNIILHKIRKCMTCAICMQICNAFLYMQKCDAKLSFSYNKNWLSFKVIYWLTSKDSNLSFNVGKVIFTSFLLTNKNVDLWIMNSNRYFDFHSVSRLSLSKTNILHFIIKMILTWIERKLASITLQCLSVHKRRRQTIEP